MLKELSKFVPSCKGLFYSRIYSINKVFYSLQSSTVKDLTDEVPCNTNDSTENQESDKLFGRLELEIKGCDPAVLKSYSWFAANAAENLGIEVGRNFALRKSQKDRLTLLKSVHIYKKHRVQYEIRTYFRFIHFHKLTGSTLGTFLEYIERNLPEGVALKATKVEIQALPDHLKSTPNA